MLARALALLLLAASLPACIIVDTGGGPPPVACNLGSCFDRPAGSIAVDTIGKGLFAADDGFPGYIITGNVGSFRITWTGFQEFRGSVFAAQPGASLSFFPGCQDGACGLASREDQVILGPGGRVDFVSYPLSGKRSGFDVEINNGTILYLDLLVNDVRRPDLVTYPIPTGQMTFAPDMPFGLQ